MLDIAFVKPALPRHGALVLPLAEDAALAGLAQAIDAASGGAVARALAAEGVSVVVSGRRGERAAAIAAELPRAVGVEVDLGDEDGPARLVAAAEEAFGPGALDEPRAARGRRGLVKGHLPFTTAAKAALSQAVRAAALHRDNEIGSAQLFLGLLTDEDVVLTLRRLGVDASSDDLTRLIRVQLDQAA